MTMGEWMDAYAAEYTAEAVAEATTKAFDEGEQSGFAKGRTKALLDILADLGPVPEEFHARLQDIDEDTLKCWTKLAARADGMEEFLEQI